MKRSKELYKAIGNLGLNAAVCNKCNGHGKWIFFEKSGHCQNCYGTGIVMNCSYTATSYHDTVKQIKEYIDSGTLHLDEMLKHSHNTTRTEDDQ
jgi:DnaJ-class molecular chaperone